MRGSVDKLRWGLAGGAVLLILLLVAFVGYGRYKAMRTWKSRLDKLGIHVERETDGYTFSQSLQGRTTMTLHAAKAIEHKDGKLTLHNVVVTLYGRHSDRFDRISGAEFEYDDKSGVAKAVGEVHMDIRAPAGVAKGGGDPAAQGHSLAVEGTESDPRDIHVRTSGLVFIRKLGVAATDQQVEFRYAGLLCTAKGAEFDSGESAVHLLADVHLDGDLRGKPMALLASKADLNRDTNIVALATPQILSDGRKAQAANAVLHLRKDGSIETAQAGGGVLFEKGTRRLRADRLEARLGLKNVPEHARLLGGVTVDDSDPMRLVHGSSAELDGAFNADGAPANWTAIGGVQLHTANRNADGQTFTRNLRGDRIEAQFKPGGGKGKSRIAEVHVLGSALATAETPASASVGPKGDRKTVQVAADNLRAVFAPSGGSTPEVRQVFGEGHTRLQQDAPRGEQQISTGDRLELALAAGEKQGGSPQLVSVTQAGHVEVQSRSSAKGNGGPTAEPILAKADRSSFDAATSKLLLAGNAQFTQGGLSVSSASATVDQRSGDSDAQGNVMATVVNAQRHDSEATHVRADVAHLQRGSQLVEFRGSDTHPVRLWQGASQVEAATLLLDGRRKTLAARAGSPRGTIRAVFAANSVAAHGAKDKAAIGGAGEGRQITNVIANRMDYDDAVRAATFDGDVHVSGATGQVQAQHAVAFLAQAPTTLAAAAPVPAKARDALILPIGGSLQKVVIWGDVHLNQPGRIARGERLVYSSADLSFVLTGTLAKLPQVVDAERGSITGTALLFRTGDNTVIVSGPTAASNAIAGQGGRVRTEIGAKQ